MRCLSKRKMTAFAAAMVLTIAAALWFLRSGEPMTLTLIDAKTGFTYLTAPMESGSFFEVSFVHSVNRSLIVERYQIAHGEIVLEECLFSSYGAGVASQLEPGQQLRTLEDGRMLLTGIHRTMPELTYRIGKVTDHVLSVGDRHYSLTELCGQNTPVRFVLHKD